MTDATPRAHSLAAPPPPRGMGLSLRLGLFATIAVTGVMATISGVQLTLDLRTESRALQARLAESVAPLVTDLRSSRTPEESQRAFRRFQAAYVSEGYRGHDLALVDSSGRVIFGARARDEDRRRAFLSAKVSLDAPAVSAMPLALVVTEDAQDLSAATHQHWRAWALHVGVTALLILLLLSFIIRREITRPVDRLLRDVRRMEQGYWDDVTDPGGAWEIRWLGWRFRTLGQELTRTVEHVVAAQRRAYAIEREVVEAPTEVPDTLPPAGHATVDQRVDDAVERLQRHLTRLRSAEAGDPAAYAMARHVWARDAILAEELGRPDLRISLEDAALRVLDPAAGLQITSRIEMEGPSLEAFAGARQAQLHKALSAASVPVVGITHRVKHSAGIWNKMRQKNLLFEQVHDLVALRIVVPTEADCYFALGVVQDLYAPIVGRFKDYIADPKPNGYRSLHLSVRDTDRNVFEVQVRSVAMDRHASHEDAAHSAYKDTTRVAAPARRGALRQVLAGIVHRWRASSPHENDPY